MPEVHVCSQVAGKLLDLKEYNIAQHVSSLRTFVSKGAGILLFFIYFDEFPSRKEKNSYECR